MKVLVLAGFLIGSKEPSFLAAQNILHLENLDSNSVLCFLHVHKTWSNLDEACVKEELVSDLGGGSNDVCFNV